MKEGLLWYDDNPGYDLSEKIRRAVRRYKQKFGAVPNVCYVHPSALSDNVKMQRVGEVRVSSQSSVLQHHFWVGQEETPRSQRGLQAARN
jgi:hypothetical protein